MTAARDTFEFLTGEIADASTQWSLGTFGAIAEFMRDPNEPVTLSRDQDAATAVTARGAIRIAPPPETRPFAFETTTRESWSGRVALCLPERDCVMSRRRGLTEIGPDTNAIREQDRNGNLFDLGIDAMQVDLFVRVADPAVAACLRVHAGQPVMEPGSEAMRIILASNPHRVFVSRVGRIEVYQPIPPADGRSPQGPHTHVLPDLLRRGRTHAATEPIPHGFVPCAHLYPAHPAKDAMGNSRPFDARRHESFQRMLRAFGDPGTLALKQRVLAAIAAGEGPAAIKLADGRFVRTNVRVALRQIRASRGDVPGLAAWMQAHERSAGEDRDDSIHRHHR